MLRFNTTVFTLFALALLGLALVASAQDGDTSLFELDPSDFDASSIVIDNSWLPLVPGTEHVYEGYTVEDGEQIDHTIVSTVTDLVKQINGIDTVVVWERDFSDDMLVEAELAFFAQDLDGNVWYFGEYSEVYDDTELVGGRMWVVGHMEGTHAGIMMPVDPQMGTPSYSEGYAPAPFNWTDRGQVGEMGVETCITTGCYDDALIIREYNTEEPEAVQLKYYARGVGNIQVGWDGDDSSQETLELVEDTLLSPEELAQARADALELEARANVYGSTPLARQVAR